MTNPQEAGEQSRPSPAVQARWGSHRDERRYFCTRPLLDPSCVTHLTTGRVIEPGRQQLILVKGSVVEIVGVSDNDAFIEPVSADDLYETILGVGVIEWSSQWDHCSKMEEFRSKDLLVVITESGGVYVTGFDSRYCCLALIQHFSVTELALKFSLPGFTIKTDPRLGVLTLAARHDYVCFLPYAPRSQAEQILTSEGKEELKAFDNVAIIMDILNHCQMAEFMLSRELESKLNAAQSDDNSLLCKYLIMDVAILSELPNSLDRYTVALLVCPPQSVDQRVITLSVSVAAKVVVSMSSIEVHHLCTGFANFIGGFLLPIIGKGVSLLNFSSLDNLEITRCCNYDQSYQNQGPQAPVEHRRSGEKRLPAVGSAVFHIAERYLECEKEWGELREDFYPFVTSWTEKITKDTQGESREMTDSGKEHSSHVYPVLSCMFEDGSIRDLSFFGDSSYRNVLAAWDDLAYTFEHDDTTELRSLNPEGNRRVLKTISLLHSDGIYMLFEDGTFQIHMRKNMMTLRSVPWRKNISPLLLLASSVDHGNGSEKVLCVSGGCQPSIDAFQDGYSVEIIAQSDVNDAELRNEHNSASITGIWAVALTTAGEENAHDLIVLSFVDQTRVLNFQENLEDISEASKFIQTEATICSGRLADNMLVQVCPSRVNLVSYTSRSAEPITDGDVTIQGRCEYVWQPGAINHSGSEATISMAIIEDGYLALITGRRIVLLVLREDDNPKLECISFFSFDDNVEISTMQMFKSEITSSRWEKSERLVFCVGTYQPSLEIVAFNPETEAIVHCGRKILQLHENEGIKSHKSVHKSAVYVADTIPEGIVSLKDYSTDRKSCLLFVGLRNGSVVKCQVSLREHTDDNHSVSTKADLSFESFINLDVVPIKLAPITIDQRFCATDGPPSNRKHLSNSLRRAKSAVVAFTNAGDQWLLTAQASLDGIFNSSGLVKIDKLQIDSSFWERYYSFDGSDASKAVDSSRGIICLCSLKCTSPFLHNALAIATKDKFAIASLKLDSLCEESLISLQEPPRRLLSQSSPLRRCEVLLAQDDRSQAGSLCLIDLHGQREMVAQSLHKDETAYGLSVFLDMYIVATTGPRRIEPPKVGFDLPNEDLTLQFRASEMVMDNDDAINPLLPQEEVADSNKFEGDAESQQDEDSCRILFFSLLRLNDNTMEASSQSLCLVEEAKLPGPGLACLSHDNYLLLSAGNYLFVLEMAGTGLLRQIASTRLRNYIVKIHKLEDVDPSAQRPVEDGEHVLTFACVDCYDGPMVFSLIGQSPVEKHKSKHRQHYLTYSLQLEWTDPRASYKLLHTEAIPLSWKEDHLASFVKTRSNNVLVGIQAKCAEVSVLEIPHRTRHPERNFLETAIARLPEAITSIVSVPFGSRHIKSIGSRRASTTCHFVIVGTEIGRLVELTEIRSFLDYEILMRVQCAQICRVPFVTSFAAHNQHRLSKFRGYVLGVPDSAYPMIDGRVLRQFSVCPREMQQEILEDAKAGCLFAIDTLIKKLPSLLRTPTLVYRQLHAEESARNELFREDNATEGFIRPVEDGLQLQTVWNLFHKYQLL